MPRFVAVALNALGLRGAAVAVRAIARLEKAAVKLNTAALHLEEDIAEAEAIIIAKRTRLQQEERDHASSQKVKFDVRNRALRTSIRLTALVS